MCMKRQLNVTRNSLLQSELFQSLERLSAQELLIPVIWKILRKECNLNMQNKGSRVRLNPLAHK